MKRLLGISKQAVARIGLSIIGPLAVVAQAQAALAIGDPAPEFTATAALAGEVHEFSLAKALSKGPVVLYFFPASFTKGCTIEAHLFAEAIDEFSKLGATVIGVSGDDVDTQKRFSASECRGRFAVLADPKRQVMKAYDAVLPNRPTYANRTSYLISPEGRIVSEYTSLAPEQHVARMMDALRGWKARKAGRPSS